MLCNYIFVANEELFACLLPFDSTRLGKGFYQLEKDGFETDQRKIIVLVSFRGDIKVPSKQGRN